LFNENDDCSGPQESLVYGDPPPSYKQAKYFPKANFSKENNLLLNKNGKPSSSKITEVNESHVYENIEDVLNKSNTREGSQQKRTKFQGLKNNSNKRNSNSITESSTESINVVIVKKNLSSPINETAD